MMDRLAVVAHGSVAVYQRNLYLMSSFLLPLDDLGK